MKTTVHNKLVRDFIPGIIESKGKSCSTSILGDTRYIEELKKKLVEESQEVCGSDSKEELIEELGDVLDVIESIQKAVGIEKADLEHVKNQKAQSNGRFDKRIFLCSVDED